MRLYGTIEKVDEVGDGTVHVHGIASSESIDDQGEVVAADAMRAAIPDYMRFPALREMHQLCAAGKTLEADVGDDNVTRIVAHVVDPVAASKVRNQVYRGFSIGGRVTKREPGNPKHITGLVLNEISLVDRPANPDSIFQVWKAADMQTTTQPAAVPAMFDSPVQIWACGVSDHTHSSKTEAVKCLEKRAAGGTIEVDPTNPEHMAAINKHAEAGVNALQAQMDEALAGMNTLTAAFEAAGFDVAKAGDKPKGDYGDVSYADPGHQADGKPRYPVDSERHIRAAWSYINQEKNHKGYTADQVSSIKSKIIAAWKDKIDPDGPPSAKVAVGDAEALIEAQRIERAALYVCLGIPEPAMVHKSIWDIPSIANCIACLRQVHQNLLIETIVEGDDSALPAQAAAACELLCRFLVSLVAEETSEIMQGTEISAPVDMAPMAPIAMAAVIGEIRKMIPETDKAEALVSLIEKAGRRHDSGHQLQLNTAAYAIRAAMNVTGAGALNRASMASAAKMRKAVLDAGATNVGGEGREMMTGDSAPSATGGTQHSTTDTGRNARTAVPNQTGAVPATPVPGEAQQGTQKASNPFAEIDAMVKGGASALQLLGYAHDAVRDVCKGATCLDGTSRPPHVNQDDMESMHLAHGAYMEVPGTKCAASNPVPGDQPTPAGESEGQGTANSAGATADLGSAGEGTAKVGGGSDDLAKLATRLDTIETTQTAGLTKLTEALTALTGLVQKIHDAPNPSALRRTAVVAKNGAMPGVGNMDDLQVALAIVEKASPDQRAMAAIRTSLSNPVEIRGITDGPAARLQTGGAAQQR